MQTKLCPIAVLGARIAPSDIHLKGFQKAGERKNRLANRLRHLPKILYAYNIELPQLVGICVLSFLYISNGLAVKHKKNIWPLDSAIYEKYYSPILSSYPNLWGVGIMTFLHISNRLAAKHIKHIWPLEGATYQK